MYWVCNPSCVDMLLNHTRLLRRENAREGRYCHNILLTASRAFTCDSSTHYAIWLARSLPPLAT